MTPARKFIAQVKAIQPQLPAMIGDDATEIGEKLVPLLQQAEQNPEDLMVLTRIRLLFRHYPEIGEWLEAEEDDETDGRTAKGVTRSGYQGLAGEMTEIDAEVYICPNEKCNRLWFRRDEAQDPPICNRGHDPVRLVPISKQDDQ